jgi:hypothetical protein
MEQTMKFESTTTTKSGGKMPPMQDYGSNANVVTSRLNGMGKGKGKGGKPGTGVKY